MKHEKPIIGLCGAIGAGKSAVAAAFAACRCLVIDSDKLNHEVLRTAEVRDILTGWWGVAILGEDGHIDRRRIGAIVFDQPQERQRLESLVYPLIATRREAMIRAGIKNPETDAIILDSPLLFESNLHELCDSVVFVEAGESERLARLKRSRGWDENEIRRRERWQMPPATKRARADFVIANHGPLASLRFSVERILEQIRDSGFTRPQAH